MNCIKTWTKSKTSRYLTDYAEGISCSNFDNRKFYTSRYISYHMWYVCNSSIFTHCYSSMMNDLKDLPKKFFRLRIVKISEENHFSCSCDYYKRWLMSCVHICKVIDVEEFYTPDLFHICWWKHFHYLSKNNESNNNSNTVKELNETYKKSMRMIFSKQMESTKEYL